MKNLPPLPPKVRAHIQAQEKARAAALNPAPSSGLESAQLRGALYAVLLAVCDNPDCSHGSRNIRILERHFFQDASVPELARQFGVTRQTVTGLIGRVKREAAQHRNLLGDVLETPLGPRRAVRPLAVHPHVLHGTPRQAG